MDFLGIFLVIKTLVVLENISNLLLISSVNERLGSLNRHGVIV